MVSLRRAPHHQAPAPAPAAPLLCLDHVRVGYGARSVLDDISLTMTRGEVVGIIGPNGAGKSTLIRAITRILPCQGGTITVDGVPVSALRPAALARIVAVVPQAATVPEALTGMELVLLGRTPHLRFLQSEGAHDHAVAHRALALVDATHLADRVIGAMSGGERQRLLIARALAQEPRLLLLDEPTSHLDLTHQVQVFALVTARARAGELGVLAVVHDLTLAATFCDRLLLIADGRVCASGTPAEVLRPDILTAAFGGTVSVLIHPTTGRPVVVPLPPMPDH